MVRFEPLDSVTLGYRSRFQTFSERWNLRKNSGCAVSDLTESTIVVIGVMHTVRHWRSDNGRDENDD